MRRVGGIWARPSRLIGRGRVAALAAAVWLTGMVGGSPLLAQGCAMCKSSIAAQNDSVVTSINTGILVLLIPPLAIMSTILYVAFRARD